MDPGAMLRTEPLANRCQRRLRQGRSTGNEHRVGLAKVVAAGSWHLRRSVLAQEAEMNHLDALGGKYHVLSIPSGRRLQRGGERDVMLHQLGLIGHHVLEALLVIIQAGGERADMSAQWMKSSQRGSGRGRGRRQNQSTCVP